MVAEVRREWVTAMLAVLQPPYMTDQIVNVVHDCEHAGKDNAGIDNVNRHHDSRNRVGGILGAQESAG